MKGFTLIELLVVVAIIALLISILLPALQNARRQAQAVVCGGNVQQITVALRMYQDDHQGWLPQSHCPQSVYGDNVGATWSEAAWGVPKRALWFYLVTPTYLRDPRALACPSDPFRALFDFEARDDLTKPACGYGLNYVMRHAGSHMMNTDRRGPKRPAETILLAEVGPDDARELAPLMGSADAGGVAWPWRDGGRLLWDDGTRPWYPGITWLTARHNGKINLAAIDGSVKRVPTIQQLRSGPKLRTLECYGPVFPGPKYVCALCAAAQSGFGPTQHYIFSASKLWWWTGPFPAK